jgi:hypothetical protein
MSSTSNVNTALTQIGQTAPMALPSTIQSRAASPEKLDIPEHILADSAKFVFNMKLDDQTDATADPKAAAPVYREIITAILDKHVTATFSVEWVRVTFRPRAGNIYTFQVPIGTKPLFPDILPAFIFAKDPDKPASKFKISYVGADATPPATGTSRTEKYWLHLFVPGTCTASRAEIKEAVDAGIGKAHLKVKTEAKDFKQIDASKGKWHVNFDVERGQHQYVPENLFALSALNVSGTNLGVFMSPEFLLELPHNCGTCFEFNKWYACGCADKKNATGKRDTFQRMKAAENAKRRKRQQAAAEDASF